MMYKLAGMKKKKTSYEKKRGKRKRTSMMKKMKSKPKY